MTLRTRASLAAVWVRQRRRPRFATAAIICLFLVTLVTQHGHWAGSGDPVHYMVIAHSVAFDRDLDVANDYADPRSIIHALPDQHVRRGRDGRTRPVHDIGMPVLAAPLFFVAYRASELATSLPGSMRRVGRIDPWIALRQLVSLGMIALTTGLALQFFDGVRELPLPAGSAAVGTVAWALSPPILSHGYVFFTEVPTALTAFVVYRSLRRLSDRSVGRAFFVGALAGLLVLLHIRNAGLMVGLVAVALRQRQWSRRTTVAFASGLMVLLVVRGTVTHMFWGTYVTTPLAQVAPWESAGATVAEMLLRTAGMLVDPNHGLLPCAPIYLLAPAGWLLLRRRQPRMATDIAIIVGCYVLPLLVPMLNVQGWRGGWSPAARFLTPVAPFLGVCVVVAISMAWHAAAVRAICLAQAALTLLFWSFPMTMWSDATSGAPFVAKIVGSRLADALPRWDSWNGPLVLVSLAVLALWTLCTVSLARAAHIRSRPLSEPV